MVKIGILMIAFTLLTGIGAVWYWALSGMSPEVATAWLVTNTTLLFIGVLVSMIGSDL